MQSTFIPNRLIINNVIIGYECFHKIWHSKGKKNGLLALKLDINKAYNRVEWSFFKQTKIKLGFSINWVDLIMRCVTTISLSMINNSVPNGMIQLERGLRQGFPLSLYLFIICSKALSNIMVLA